MMLWTAFFLGLAGSLHCAGMCGPLAMALPRGGNGSLASLWWGRASYNLGRTCTYGILGVLFGLLGQTASWAGLQRWVSIAAGVAILLGLLAANRFRLGLPATQLVSRLKPLFGPLLRSSSAFSMFLLGLLNGLLPCGLVYVACAGAVATGSLGLGALFMMVFGLGTTPMMFSIGLLGARVQTTLRFRLQKLVPASLVIVAGLLIVRGMALGIPYLSPGPLDQPHACAACAEEHGSEPSAMK
jgi:sulfite exporter TauE/SafE